MKARWFVCLVVLGMAATSAWAETSNYAFPETFTANPQGEWALYYGADIGSMTPMTAAGEAKWNAGGSRPSYNEYGTEIRMGEMSSVNNAYLVFTCPQSGLYSVDLAIYSWMQQLYTVGLNTYLDVYTATVSGTTLLWSNSTPWSRSGNFWTNLRVVPELQQMTLAAGDRIIIRFGMENYGNYSEICWQLGASGFSSLSTANIVYGQEAVTTRFNIPSSFASNPANNWGLYYGADKNHLTPMAQSGALWYSNTSNSRPTFNEWNFPGFRMSGMTGDTNAYLVFSCPQTGKYSMKFRVQTNMQNFLTGGVNTRYAVYTSLSDTPVFSYALPWSATGTYPLEYWYVAELQEMQLTAGDQIIMMFGMDLTNNYDEAVSYFDGDYHTPGVSPNITFVPFVPEVKIAGDANGDKMVDVSDLGILAANYGMTSGAVWSQGDFNEDGAVDVSDLGILAANYGTGTGAALDFNADAKALGLTGDAKAETSNVSSLGCGSAGLPLLSGILLAGMFLGGLKMKE